jgi:hypothetical protein
MLCASAADAAPRRSAIATTIFFVIIVRFPFCFNLQSYPRLTMDSCPSATSTRYRSAVHVSDQDNPSSRRRFVFLIAAFSILRNEGHVVRGAMDELAQSNLIHGTPKKDKPALQR